MTDFNRYEAERRHIAGLKKRIAKLGAERDAERRAKESAEACFEAFGDLIPEVSRPTTSYDHYKDLEKYLANVAEAMVSACLERDECVENAEAEAQKYHAIVDNFRNTSSDGVAIRGRVKRYQGCICSITKQPEGTP